MSIQNVAAKLQERLNRGDDDSITNAFRQRLAGEISQSELVRIIDAERIEDTKNLVQINPKSMNDFVIDTDIALCERDYFFSLLEELIAAYDPEENHILLEPVETCPDCTHGTVPNNLNRGPCLFHRVTRALMATNKYWSEVSQ